MTFWSASRRRATAHGAAAEKLIVVMGSKGGVGATTVAVNLGVQISTHAQKRTVLLDLARPLGNAHLLLDLHPRFGIRDAIENLDRLDSHFFAGLLERHKSKLEILGGAMQPEEWQNIPTEPAGPGRERRANELRHGPGRPGLAFLLRFESHSCDRRG